MTATEAVALLGSLQEHGVDACVGGGWGVDALLGEQTREHADLDLWLPTDRLEPLFVALSGHGVDRVLPWPDDRPWNFVLHDGARRRIDLHLYEPLPDGTMHYGSVSDGATFPAEALAGGGGIAGSAHDRGSDQPMPKPTAALTEFVRAYEQATNSHDITQLVPLIAPAAVYWFSDGSHRGREAVLAAIAETFATIRDEVYRIDELEWITHSDHHAVCRYRFSWTGTVGGRPQSGSGRGTNVLVNTAGTWQMLHEHLSA
ncbi:DUF4440 domain-containing protein [Streptomyces sp. NBC_01476]|uniref:nucleotidyltransferase domain-containing protein n=1 Tax=Streptomyces sp. NBC_01476 TaxID=2903881 RepID=UPI002E317F39|nr:DUF4440 domain-containing protein [Streptomyces sp. NBC_01476]